MIDKYLHIVTHDIPYPADFGGVIDIFYKIKTLHQNGVKIFLHCFENKRPRQNELDKYCVSVNYYKRNTDLRNFSFKLPFIVSSRKSDELLQNLQKDNYPILFEGIHSTYHFFNGSLNNRVVVLRLFNAEFEYYHHLAMHEKNPFRKLYFAHESKLLKKYESKLATKVPILALSGTDVELYQDNFGATNIKHLPVFLPYLAADGKEGHGCYCLYHANLSVNENEEAALWLVQHVFNDLNIPFVIAGKNPSQKLVFLTEKNPEACVVANPTDMELHDLISKAQINILPSFNNTGVKLKLLNALYNGRHCIANNAGVAGSGLNRACTIAEDEDDFKTAVKYLYDMPYTNEENNKRQQLLQLYNNQQNADKLIEILWG